jgi:hypothetical protein
VGTDPLRAFSLSLSQGRDATQLFEAYHPVWVSKTLERYRVGSLIDSEHPTFPPMSEFYLTLKQRVERHFKDAGVKHTQGTRLLLTSIVLIFATLAAWVGAVYAAQVRHPSRCALSGHRILRPVCSRNRFRSTDLATSGRRLGCGLWPGHGASVADPCP